MEKKTLKAATKSGRLSSTTPSLSNAPSGVKPVELVLNEETLECKTTEKPTYNLKFDDCTKRKLPASITKEPLFIFEFKGKEKYVVSRTNKLVKEKAYMHFTVNGKSYSVREADLRNMSLKTKKDILGIEFEDAKTKTKYYLVIQDYAQWLNDRDYETAQRLMKEFSK
jgi:hypothetical protein